MFIRTIIYSLLLYLLFISHATSSDSGYLRIADSLFPQHTACSQIVKHRYYALCYYEKHEQASWVIYSLTKDNIEKSSYKRKNIFYSDTLIATQSARYDDYTGTGYDRGHLCPAKDMSWNEAALKETFFMSNISPQLHYFNAGIWKKLEEQVRKWALQKDELIIITGGVLTDNLPKIGNKNKITVPDYFYKIIVELRNLNAIAFVLNSKIMPETPLMNMAISVDSVERFTGINFFEKLTDSVENRIESKVNTDFWWE